MLQSSYHVGIHIILHVALSYLPGSSANWKAPLIAMRLRFRSPGEGRKDARRIYINKSVFIQGEEHVLEAAVAHHGKTGDVGHYTSLVRYGTVWWAIDDSVWKQVKNINQALLEIQGGYQNCSYLLFYKKCT